MMTLYHMLMSCQQDSSYILGEGERGRTRSQTRKISESGEEDKKPGVKRTGTMEQTIKVGGGDNAGLCASN